MPTLPSKPVQLLTAPWAPSGDTALTALTEDGRIFQYVWDGAAYEYRWRAVPGYVAPTGDAILTPGGAALVTSSERQAA